MSPQILKILLLIAAAAPLQSYRCPTVAPCSCLWNSVKVSIMCCHRPASWAANLAPRFNTRLIMHNDKLSLGDQLYMLYYRACKSRGMPDKSMNKLIYHVTNVTKYAKTQISAHRMRRHKFGRDVNRLWHQNMCDMGDLFSAQNLQELHALFVYITF